MSDNSLKIMEMVSDYLLDNPEERFCEALMNMAIIEQAQGIEFLCTNPYYHSDADVLERIKARNSTM